jgi:predicted O-methyltransferase YrrM
MEFLEIGSFEGRATCWLLQNGLAPSGRITCIDTFAGGEEHGDLELGGLRQRFDENVCEAMGKDQDVKVIAATSYDGLANCIYHNYRYDFIYIDGSHQASDVLTDACMAFGMLNKGGIMLFDDYLWDHVPGILHQPKIAVDSFVNIFNGQCRVVIMGYQQGIMKL